MPAEVAENSQPNIAPVRTESAMTHEAQNAWAPGTAYFKLGAICNDTYTQSLATQYDHLDQFAITGIENGFKAILALGVAGCDLAKDVTSVDLGVLQINVEKITNPALAEVHSYELDQNMREMRTKYERVLQPIKQDYVAVQTDLEDIGARTNSDNKAYSRLLTDPAKNIANAIDKFTSQTPGEQVKAIADQATQAAALGVAEKYLGGAVRLSTAEISAKFDGLFSKMESELGRWKDFSGSPNLATSLSDASTASVSDSMLMSKADDAAEAARPRETKRAREKREAREAIEATIPADAKILPEVGFANTMRLREVFGEACAAMGIKIEDQNIAYAVIDIPGKPQELISIAGEKSPVGTVGKPENPIFKVVHSGAQRRDVDSEYKILEDIAKGLKEGKDGPTGTISLYTEQIPCDRSCWGVIDQFRERFPNITLAPSWSFDKADKRIWKVYEESSKHAQ